MVLINTNNNFKYILGYSKHSNNNYNLSVYCVPGATLYKIYLYIHTNLLHNICIDRCKYIYMYKIFTIHKPVR